MTYDVIIIGGGTAGLVTASGCARLGRRVALIERQALGGDCLWSGCVPTKALVATARLAHQMRNASAFGLEPVEPRMEPARVLDSMREAQRIIGRHDDPARFRKLGIDVIEGEARLLSTSSVAAGGRTLVAKDVVIATGSRTAVPPVEGLEAAGFVDHATFLAGDQFPRSVVILGGGAIGIEFAQVLRRFGCEVTVVEMLDSILPKEDDDVIARVRDILSEEGVAFRTGWRVKSVRVEEGRKVAEIEDARAQSDRIVADEIFVASGRRGNIESLGLEGIGVSTERSYISVDRYLQTSVGRVWACGDVHGGLQFTHVAAYEAVKLVRNMLFPGKSAVRYDDVPWATYIDPEVAHLGKTEREAIDELGRANIRTYKVDMIDVDRAVVDRSASGFVKFVCDRQGKILGAHAICPHASTLIEEIVVARKKRMRIGEIAQLVSAYPSLADGVQKAAAQYYQDLSSSMLGALARRLAAWSQ
jgi:pyruvate/2-oxoglutarate dehydrogenase complex dihydrolipoamide dehydrogenase (E3) component